MVRVCAGSVVAVITGETGKAGGIGVVVLAGVVVVCGGVTTCIEGMLLVLMATGPSIRFFFTIEPFSAASSIASCKKLV